MYSYFIIKVSWGKNRIVLGGTYLEINSGQLQDLMIICILIPQSLGCLVFVWNIAHSFNDVFETLLWMIDKKLGDYVNELKSWCFHTSVCKYRSSIGACVSVLTVWVSGFLERHPDYAMSSLIYIMCFLKITKNAFNSSDSQKSHVIYKVSAMMVSEKYKDHYVTFGKCFDEMLDLIRYCIYIAYFIYRLVWEAAIKMSSKNWNHLWNIYCFTSWYMFIY